MRVCDFEEWGELLVLIVYGFGMVGVGVRIWGFPPFFSYLIFYLLGWLGGCVDGGLDNIL